jgi:hypothetical protein
MIFERDTGHVRMPASRQRPGERSKRIGGTNNGDDRQGPETIFGAKKRQRVVLEFKMAAGDSSAVLSADQTAGGENEEISKAHKI